MITEQNNSGTVTFTTIYQSEFFLLKTVECKKNDIFEPNSGAYY